MTESEIEALEEEQLECQRQMWREDISMREYDKEFDRWQEIERLLKSAI